MLARMQKSLKEKDQGFTLIELLVVIIIIGILAAIAIPIFLNQQKKGIDAGVKSDLKQVADIEETWHVDNPTYADATATTAWTDLKVTNDNQLDVALNKGGYCIRGNNPNGSRTGSSFYYYDSLEGGLSTLTTAPAGACTAAASGSLTWTVVNANGPAA